MIRDVLDASGRLKSGQLVAFPTETVYGLGASALNTQAIARIFEAKQRPRFDPLIVHIADVRQLSDVVCEIPAVAHQLARRFWPGPLTLVLPKRDRIPDLVTSGLPGVGVRIPDHPLALRLLKAVECPIAAPSANPFGGVSPTEAQHVLQGLSGRIDAVIDGGSCGIGLESTVVSLMRQEPVVLRLGGLPLESIEEVTGPIQVAVSDSKLSDKAQPAPGMLSRHYAPETLIVTVDSDTVITPTHPRSALLTWGPTVAGCERFTAVENLSNTGDLARCAANFFAAIRRLDAASPDVIIARKFPDQGLGRALNDRLKRASG
ncbi:MAG: threonylcarbamoyl-AMP synthase [Fuerstiella sp.]|nr:threonylcarbamoyl-AMP synthase [Fuerstiella sp.]